MCTWLSRLWANGGSGSGIRRRLCAGGAPDFARHLRALGVQQMLPTATFAAGGGLRKPDEIYRASLRGQSIHIGADGKRRA